MKKYLFPFALLLSACQSTPQNAGKPLYWDVSGFFQQQVDALQHEAPQWEKKVQIAGKQEVKVLQDVDWSTELALFLESDLNKVAYTGYVSEQTDDSLTIFQVTEPDLPIREVKVAWSAPQVPARVEIQWHSENKVYETDRTLKAYFTQGKLDGYAIQTYQKIIGLSPDEVWVQGKRKGS